MSCRRITSEGDRIMCGECATKEQEATPYIVKIGCLEKTINELAAILKEVIDLVDPEDEDTDMDAAVFALVDMRPRIEAALKKARGE